MEERGVWLRLGDWADQCDHAGTAGDLPLLWIAVTHEEWTGWANLALHWTGSQWTLCAPADWVLGDGPTDEQLQTMVTEAIRTASATPLHRWRTLHRDDLHASLHRAQRELTWVQEREASTRTWIQQVECAAAAADLPDGEPRRIAHRLLRDWTGTADDLLTTAHALSTKPATNPPPASTPDDDQPARN